MEEMLAESASHSDLEYEEGLIVARGAGIPLDVLKNGGDDLCRGLSRHFANRVEHVPLTESDTTERGLRDTVREENQVMRSRTTRGCITSSINGLREIQPPSAKTPCGDCTTSIPPTHGPCGSWPGI